MPFDYWHRKQTGGRGEYARVIGYIEPLPAHLNTTNEFLDRTTGTNVPAQFKPGIKKGFFDYCEKGQVYHYHAMNRPVPILIGELFYQFINIRFILLVNRTQNTRS